MATDYLIEEEREEWGLQMEECDSPLISPVSRGN